MTIMEKVMDQMFEDAVRQELLIGGIADTEKCRKFKGGHSGRFFSKM
jgi:hypothetical protein